jgi:hypothetical protein
VKPLWCVSVSLEISLPVVAETEKEAETIASEFIHGGEFLTQDADMCLNAMKLCSLKFAPISPNDYPLGTEEDPELETLSVGKYIDKYIEWKLEEKKKEELEKKQGKLF